MSKLASSLGESVVVSIREFIRELINISVGLIRIVELPRDELVVDVMKLYLFHFDALYK